MVEDLAYCKPEKTDLGYSLVALGLKRLIQHGNLDTNVSALGIEPT
jgi:hypothetical protein